MSELPNVTPAPAPGGIALNRALAALRTLEPHARAFWIHDLDTFASRAIEQRAPADAHERLGHFGRQPPPAATREQDAQRARHAQ